MKKMIVILMVTMAAITANSGEYESKYTPSTVYDVKRNGVLAITDNMHQQMYFLECETKDMYDGKVINPYITFTGRYWHDLLRTTKLPIMRIVERPVEPVQKLTKEQIEEKTKKDKEEKELEIWYQKELAKTIAENKKRKVK